MFTELPRRLCSRNLPITFTIEVNPDCGLRTRTWEVSLEKLKHMVEGTRLAEVALNGS